MLSNATVEKMHALRLPALAEAFQDSCAGRTWQGWSLPSGWV